MGNTYSHLSGYSQPTNMTASMLAPEIMQSLQSRHQGIACSGLGCARPWSHAPHWPRQNNRKTGQQPSEHSIRCPWQDTWTMAPGSHTMQEHMTAHVAVTDCQHGWTVDRWTSVKWEVFRVVKDQSLTALTTLNTFRHPSCFTDELHNLVKSVKANYSEIQYLTAT
jgi:hypothetical protein